MKKQRNRKFWAVILSAALFVTQLSTVAKQRTGGREYRSFRCSPRQR